MSNSKQTTMPTPRADGQELFCMSTPGDCAYHLLSKEVFDPAAISSVDDYDEKYLEPTRAGLREIQDLIYKELEINFFEHSAAQIRMYAKFKIGWRADYCMKNIDTQSLPKHIINPYHLDDWTNKEVMVYFEPRAVDTSESQRIARYIFRAWLRLHNGRPFFQRDGFFGKPLLLRETGPQSLQEISTFHSNLSQYVSTHVEDLVEFKPLRSWSSSYPGEQVPKDETPGDIRSWREHGYHMSHLFRALYLVVDKQSLPETPGLYYQLPELEGYDRIHKLDQRVEKQLEPCTILLVKTGDEAHLSSPISFLPLFEAGLALNVNRDDYTGGSGGEETAVRVKLDVAVRFVKTFILLFFSLKHLFVISASALSFNSSPHCLLLLNSPSVLWLRQHFCDGSLNQIASVFAEYKHDEDVGFENVKGVPCLSCVANLNRDVSCICVRGNEPTSCVLCDHYENQCGGSIRMPLQLLGVAQWYWNFVKALDARDLHRDGSPPVQPYLTSRQFWRLNLALKACGGAWRGLERHLKDPNNFAILALQELTSAREIATHCALHSVTDFPGFATIEFRNRIAAFQPAYTRDGNCVDTLRDALARLSVAENTVVQSVPEQKCDSLPQGFPDDLQDAMYDNRDSRAPRSVVVHNSMPSLFGQY
ncbi:hypothetical protein F52700_2863 [Fusarium sp. NRRL 52700]|nr:hypothetical protein F52700_2863 [Fusarium sp. NRRL 52700]